MIEDPLAYDWSQPRVTRMEWQINIDRLIHRDAHGMITKIKLYHRKRPRQGRWPKWKRRSMHREECMTASREVIEILAQMRQLHTIVARLADDVNDAWCEEGGGWTPREIEWCVATDYGLHRIAADLVRLISDGDAASKA